MPNATLAQDFSSGPPFQLLGFAIGAIGTGIGVLGWLDGQRKNRIYKKLFEVADKNIDRDLTDEQLNTKKSEVALVSEQVADLRRRIEVEIPLEAKRTVLRDRLDWNIKILHQTLASTSEIKAQLESIGTHAGIPSDLLKSVEAEILPEYVSNARRESLKTSLIVIMSLSAFTSAVVPRGIALLVQIPLLVLSAFILGGLFRGPTARSMDPATLKMAAAALYAGAITASMFAAAVWPELTSERGTRSWDPKPIANFGPFVAITLGVSLMVLCGWIFRRNRGLLWRILGCTLAIFGFGICGLSTIILDQADRVLQSAALYLLALLAVTLAASATITVSKLFKIAGSAAVKTESAVHPGHFDSKT